MESLAAIVGGIYLGLILLGLASFVMALVARIKGKLHRTAWLLLAVTIAVSAWALFVSVPLGIIPSLFAALSLLVLLIPGRAKG